MEDRRDIEKEDYRPPVFTLDLWSGSTGRLLHSLRWQPHDEEYGGQRDLYLGLHDGIVVMTGVGTHVIRYRDGMVAAPICCGDEESGGPGELFLFERRGVQPGVPRFLIQLGSTWAVADLESQRCMVRKEPVSIGWVALAPSGAMAAAVDSEDRLTVASAHNLARRFRVALPRDPSTIPYHPTGSYTYPEQPLLFTQDSRFVVYAQRRRLLAVNASDGSAISIELRQDGTARFSPIALARDEPPEAPALAVPFGPFRPLPAAP